MGRYGHGDDAHVLGILTQRRKGELLYLSVALEGDALLSQVAHRLLRFDPGTSALAPSGAVEDAYLDVELCGFLQRGMQHFPPLWCQCLYLAWLDVFLPDVADEGTVNASLLHCLQVVLNALNGNVVRYPVPIDGYPLFASGCLELGE